MFYAQQIFSLFPTHTHTNGIVDVLDDGLQVFLEGPFFLVLDVGLDLHLHVVRGQVQVSALAPVHLREELRQVLKGVLVVRQGMVLAIRLFIVGALVV